MSDVDTRGGLWEPKECCKNLRLVTCPVEACVPAIRFQDCSIRELYCLQGTSKVLHPKSNNPARCAWAATGSVKKTVPAKFIKEQKTSLRAQNRNNCRTIDKDFTYSACATKVVNKQRTINKVNNCKLSKFDCQIEETAELSTCDNEISFLNTQPKPNDDIVTSSWAQKHSESQETEPNHAVTVVEICPGVKSYILDMSSTDLNNQNNPEGKKDNESNTEEQLFCTLKKYPCPPDMPGVKSYSLGESPRVHNNQFNSEVNQEYPRVHNNHFNSEVNQESPRVQNIQDNSEVNQDNESQLEEQLFCSLNDCPNPPDSSDDDTAVSWYRDIVERELELYLKKLRSRMSKGCHQEGDTTPQSASSRQNAQQAKIVDSDQMYEINQSRRINRTARYVRFLLWKENIAKSKDRLDMAEKPKVWKPT